MSFTLLMVLLFGQDAQPTELPLDVLDSGHRVLAVEVDEQGPFPFIIDTGANTTSLMVDFAEAFGFEAPALPDAQVHAFASVFDSYLFSIDKFRLQDGVNRPIDAVILPQHSAELFNVAGLIGNDAFAGQQYSIDLERNRVLLGTPVQNRVTGTFDTEYRLLFGEVRIPGQRLRTANVMIDTGAMQSVINSAFAESLPERFRIIFSPSISGVDETPPEPTQWAWLNGLRLGQHCAGVHWVLTADTSIFDSLGWSEEPAIVIGMDLLEGSTIHINQPDGTFHIESRTPNRPCRRR